MATRSWLIAEDIYECGCIVAGYQTSDGKTYATTNYCSLHAAAHRMCETLKSTAAYFEMLEAATGVVHPQLAEIRATLAEAEAKYPVQGRNR